MGFTEEEMVVDEGLGYPKAYAKLCRSPSVLSAYAQGPPFAFLPYTLQPQEVNPFSPPLRLWCVFVHAFRRQ